MRQRLAEARVLHRQQEDQPVGARSGVTGARLVECGHATPPKVGSVCARLGCCAPVPHDVVQVDQAPKASALQSVAHAAVLQLRVSS